MAMKSSVMTMNGRIVSETRNGVRHFHAHDQLGNTIALYDDSGTKTDSYTYWPYGEVRTRTGTTVNPYQYSGAWGCYRDSTGRTYMQARTLRHDLTRWVSVDRRWPRQKRYTYVSSMPTRFIDPSGNRPQFPGLPKLPTVGDLITPQQWTWPPHVIGPPRGGPPKAITGPVLPPPLDEHMHIGLPLPLIFPDIEQGIQHGAFEYGNYCGLIVGDPTYSIPPLDCIDAACKEHDRCLGSCEHFSSAGRDCDCKLLLDAIKCLASGCDRYFDPRFGIVIGIGKCKVAAEAIALAFSGLCGYQSITDDIRDIK